MTVHEDHTITDTDSERNDPLAEDPVDARTDEPTSEPTDESVDAPPVDARSDEPTGGERGDEPERESVAYPSGHEGFGYESHDAADPVPTSDPLDDVDTPPGSDTPPVAATDQSDGSDPSDGTAPVPPVPQAVAPSGDTTGIDGTDGYRDQWRDVQVAFVDDPRQAVGEARQLIGQVVERVVADLNAQVDQVNDSWSGEEVDTENLRVALRGYRDLLDRLLAV